MSTNVCSHGVLWRTANPFRVYSCIMPNHSLQIHLKPVQNTAVSEDEWIKSKVFLLHAFQLRVYYLLFTHLGYVVFIFLHFPPFPLHLIQEWRTRIMASVLLSFPCCSVISRRKHISPASLLIGYEWVKALFSHLCLKNAGAWAPHQNT